MSDEGRRKAELVHAALAAAVTRLDCARGDAATFAAMGELLFWLVASDETMLHAPPPVPGYVIWREAEPDRLQLFQGIRYVRNGFAHDTTAWSLTSTAARMDVRTDRFYDSYSSLVWGEAPEPSDERWRSQFEAYGRRLMGRAVLDTVLDARDEIESF